MKKESMNLPVIYYSLFNYILYNPGDRKLIFIVGTFLCGIFLATISNKCLKFLENMKLPVIIYSQSALSFITFYHSEGFVKI